MDEAERSAETLPHRKKYLLLNLGFRRSLLELHLELIATVERDVAGDARARTKT